VKRLTSLALAVALFALLAVPILADTLFLPVIVSGDPLWFFRAVDALDGLGALVGGGGSMTGAFIGRVSSDCQDQDSIICPDGPYGAPDASGSISNPNSPYGSADSDQSAYNPEATNPPHIITCKGSRCERAYYVTKNPALSPRLDPDMLLSYLRAKSDCR